VTKDEKAAPEQQQKEHADSQEKAARSSGGASEFFSNATANSRKVLQVVDKLLVFSRKWPRVQGALLSAVETLEFSIEMTKKSAELVSEYLSGSDTEQAKKEIAAVEVHTNDRWRPRYQVRDEVVRAHPTWFMRCFNGGGKHLVIDAEEMMTLDPHTRVRPLGASWRDLAPVHEPDEQEWRFLSDVNDGTFLWDQRWQTRMNPEQECHISAEGEFTGRASWNPKIQIRPIGATWEQVEEKERCRSKTKTPGVN
jgi:hypothetical protein